MTSYVTKNVECSCGNVQRFLYPSSINTFMGGSSLIQELMDGTLYTRTCDKCGREIFLNTWVIINCPRGMFTITTGKPKEFKTMFREYGVIDENDKPVDGMLERLLHSSKQEEENKNQIKLKSSEYNAESSSPRNARKEIEIELRGILEEARKEKQVSTELVSEVGKKLEEKFGGGKKEAKGSRITYKEVPKGKNNQETGNSIKKKKNLKKHQD
ncbi:MAG: hypothetical protein EAX96_17820 [Candidatus Lokiarchaeota archaeon]|nr:hypothetical protein [Candidatus Lokiarchaeota archaeon]